VNEARPWSRYRFDDGAWTDMARSRCAPRSKPKARRKKGVGKPAPFGAWLKERIPGKPNLAAAYEEPALVAVMRLDDLGGPFSRRLEGQGQGAGWIAIEPSPCFRPWPLQYPSGKHVCDLAFWTDQKGRQFAVGMDEHGGLWWLTPENPLEVSPRWWSLKRQAAIDPKNTER
jgi:hypothetical protein